MVFEVGASVVDVRWHTRGPANAQTFEGRVLFCTTGQKDKVFSHLVVCSVDVEVVPGRKGGVTIACEELDRVTDTMFHEMPL